jgi:soluble lytic murein transglycosylase-like protein
LRRAALAILILAAAPASAEIAVLGNGQTLKVRAWSFEAEAVRLALASGGEAVVPASLVRGLVPDEIVEEVQAAARETGATDLSGLIEQAARRHGLEPALVQAVVAVESGFRPGAVSRKGAMGLMQLMPATAAELGVADPLDPDANLDGGSRYLSRLLAEHGGDLRKALAAYNAGPGAVRRHDGVPPYPETRDYVARVLKRYKGGS